LVHLEFASGQVPEGLEQFGEVVRQGVTTIDLKVPPARVGEILNAILDQHAVADLSVHDPPLEQVMARVFQEAP
jgi:ABC-2 type transport system ATP-binding protein